MIDCCVIINTQLLLLSDKTNNKVTTEPITALLAKPERIVTALTGTADIEQEIIDYKFPYSPTVKYNIYNYSYNNTDH